MDRGNSSIFNNSTFGLGSEVPTGVDNLFDTTIILPETKYLNPNVNPANRSAFNPRRPMNDYQVNKLTGLDTFTAQSNMVPVSQRFNVIGSPITTTTLSRGTQMIPSRVGVPNGTLNFRSPNVIQPLTKLVPSKIGRSLSSPYMTIRRNNVVIPLSPSPRPMSPRLLSKVRFDSYRDTPNGLTRISRPLIVNSPIAELPRPRTIIKPVSCTKCFIDKPIIHEISINGKRNEMIYGIADKARRVAAMLEPLTRDDYLNRVYDAYKNDPVQAEIDYQLAKHDEMQNGPRFGDLKNLLNDYENGIYYRPTA